ncbi:MAG: hypothetical protein R3B92_02565 [Patescibacteria group bacterium]|uniref:Rod shape-determining protein n=1 Tax=candidate division WWE3 bacterium TaxID=2053526 RepID=A0A955ECF5_UNCKA|nr:rod shape-determining protein [candidate division WWE3 bacterium]
MFKLPFSFGSSKEPYFLILTLGADHIECFAVHVNTESFKPVCEIIGFGSELVGLDIIRSGVIVDFDSVVLAFKNAVATATSELDVKFRDVVFGLNSSIAFDLMTNVRLTRSGVKPLTSEEIADVYSSTSEAANAAALEEISKITGDSNIDLECITTSTVYIEVDGNKVDSLEHATGKVIELAQFCSYAPTYVTHMLQDLASALKLNVSAITSEMYALTSSIKPMLGEYFDGVIIDVGSDSTNVGVVFGGGVVNSKSISVGGSDFTKQISKLTGLSYFGAEKKKTDYSRVQAEEQNNTLTQTLMPDLEEDDTKIHQAIGSVIETWLSGVELLFSEFDGIKTFGSKIYLTGGGIMLPEILDVLTKEPWTKAIPFKSPPEFVKLNLMDLHFVSDKTGMLDSPMFIIPASLSYTYLESNSYL